MTTQQHTSTDAGLASELRIAVMRLRRRLATERHPDNDLSLGAMAVLAGLCSRGEMTLGALAEHERVQPPSMTRTVNCLAEGGYVVRRPGATDRRQVLIAITDLGRATVAADRERRDAWLAKRLGALSADERALLRAAVPVFERIANE